MIFPVLNNHATALNEHSALQNDGCNYYCYQYFSTQHSTLYKMLQNLLICGKQALAYDMLHHKLC